MIEEKVGRIFENTSIVLSKEEMHAVSPMYEDADLSIGFVEVDEFLKEGIVKSVKEAIEAGKVVAFEPTEGGMGIVAAKTEVFAKKGLSVEGYVALLDMTNYEINGWTKEQSENLFSFDEDQGILYWYCQVDLLNEPLFSEASWIADTGMFSDYLKGNADSNLEVEPFKEEVIVGRGVVDASLIDDFFRDQK